MKNITRFILAICIVFLFALIYWKGEKGRYEFKDNLILDTKTGKLYTFDKNGNRISFNQNQEDNKSSIVIYRMEVWPFLAWKSQK